MDNGVTELGCEFLGRTLGFGAQQSWSHRPRISLVTEGSAVFQRGWMTSFLLGKRVFYWEIFRDQLRDEFFGEIFRDDVAPVMVFFRLLVGLHLRFYGRTVLKIHGGSQSLPVRSITGFATLAAAGWLNIIVWGYWFRCALSQ